MSTLTIRNLGDDLESQLRIRAAEHGRSMEAEVREILRSALDVSGTDNASDERGLGTLIHQHFTDIGGAELELPERDSQVRVIEFPE